MKDFKIYLYLAFALLTVYLVAEYNKPTPINWAPTLYYRDKVPFGTYVVYHQLNHIFPGANVIKTNTSIYKALSDTAETQGNYLIIADAIKINKADYDQLVKYMAAGNSVFMASFNYDGFLADTLKLSVSFESAKGNSKLNFTSRALTRSGGYTFKKDISNQYFDSFDTAKAVVICKNNYNHSSYLSFKFGKGNLYVSTNPELFTNYSLLTPQGADYAEKALSYLPITQNVYWDEHQNGDIAGDESLFRVFFTSPALQWAYYLSLAGILIFVLFEVKRRQRIIPVIEPLANSTLEFVTVVGQVYYEKRDNANITHKKITYFLEYLRENFQLKTSTLDTEFVERLTAKTGISAEFATELVNALKLYNGQTYIADKELIHLNHLIEQFYIKSR